MRHIGEKGLPSLFAPPGGFQRIFQQFPLLKLPQLFLFYFTETEHHFLRRQGFVEQDAHTDPAVFFTKKAAKIPPEVPDFAGNKRADAFTGKILPVFLTGVRLNDLQHDLHQQAVFPGLRDPFPYVARPLDHFIGIILKIYAVQRIIGVAQDPHGLVGALHKRIHPAGTP